MQFRNLLIVFVGALLLGGLYLQYGERFLRPNVDTKRIEVSSHPENARYKIEGEFYRLFDGEFTRDTSQGSRDVQSLRLVGRPAYGDLDGDDDDDAFVILTRKTVGGETYQHAAFSIYEAGEYKGTDTFELGRSVAIDEYAIRDGRAQLSYRIRGAGEGLDTEPSHARSLRFTYDADRHAIVHVAPTDSDQDDEQAAGLFSQPWIWVRTEYSEGGEVTPRAAHVDSFVLELREEGVLQAKTDCNSISGSFDVDAQTLSFGPLAMTEMYCEDAQDAVFAQMLSDVISYRFSEAGELILELQAGTGTMHFR